MNALPSQHFQHWIIKRTSFWTIFRKSKSISNLELLNPEICLSLIQKVALLPDYLQNNGPSKLTKNCYGNAKHHEHFIMQKCQRPSSKSPPRSSLKCTCKKLPPGGQIYPYFWIFCQNWKLANGQTGEKNNNNNNKKLIVKNWFCY